MVFMLNYAPYVFRWIPLIMKKSFVSKKRLLIVLIVEYLKNLLVLTAVYGMLQTWNWPVTRETLITRDNETWNSYAKFYREC